MLEPNMIKCLIEYNKDLKKESIPSGEDYINKRDLLSNDIFCITFLTLTICNSEFIKVFSYLTNHRDTLVKFDRKQFKTLILNFMFNISHDKNLVFVLKKLLQIEKFDSGI